MGVEVTWVKAVLNGKNAEYVEGLASQGLGYIVLDKPSAKSVEVAFRQPSNYIKPHMTILNKEESDKMELLLKNR